MTDILQFWNKEFTCFEENKSWTFGRIFCKKTLFRNSFAIFVAAIYKGNIIFGSVCLHLVLELQIIRAKQSRTLTKILMVETSLHSFPFYHPPSILKFDRWMNAFFSFSLSFFFFHSLSCYNFVLQTHRAGLQW